MLHDSKNNLQQHLLVLRTINSCKKWNPLSICQNDVPLLFTSLTQWFLLRCGISRMPPAAAPRTVLTPRPSTSNDVMSASLAPWVVRTPGTATPLPLHSTPRHYGNQSGRRSYSPPGIPLSTVAVNQFFVLVFIYRHSVRVGLVQSVIKHEVFCFDRSWVDGGGLNWSIWSSLKFQLEVWSSWMGEHPKYRDHSNIVGPTVIPETLFILVWHQSSWTLTSYCHCRNNSRFVLTNKNPLSTAVVGLNARNMVYLSLNTLQQYKMKTKLSNV